MAVSKSDRGHAVNPAAARQKAKPPSPWSVRGVSREARAKAGKAASRRRETIGEWVTNALTQVANEELGSGPRSGQVLHSKGGLPTGIDQDETPLGKALLALAERFERSEKRNEAIVSLAERMEGAEYGGRDVSVMAKQTGIVEQRSRALTLLVDRLESAERRENSLLTLMHGVAERAERGEERIAAVTRGLADLALNLEAALNRNSAHTAQTISNSMAPLENAVNALGNRLPSTSAPAATAPASAHFYGNPVEPSPGEAQPYGGAATPEATPEAEPATPGDVAGGDVAGEGLAAGGKERGGRLKFDFAALKQHAINNSQRLAQDLDEPAEDERPARGGWFGKKSVSESGGQDSAEAGAGDDWESAYVAPDGAPASARSSHTEGPQEPTLDAAGPADPAPAPSAAPAPTPAPDPIPAAAAAPQPIATPDPTPAATPAATPTADADAAPAVSEEDEMLMALKQAIRPEKP